MPRHPIGKPVKIIPMGDVPAALEWVGAVADNPAVVVQFPGKDQSA